MAIFVIFCVVLLSENKYDDDESLKYCITADQ